MQCNRARRDETDEKRRNVDVDVLLTHCVSCRGRTHCGRTSLICRNCGLSRVLRLAFCLQIIPSSMGDGRWVMVDGRAEEGALDRLRLRVRA